jgi:hypothetical protein
MSARLGELLTAGLDVLVTVVPVDRILSMRAFLG